MKKRSLRSSFGHVFSSAVPWSVVFWCCFGSMAFGGQKADVRSGLQSAADLAAQAGVSSLDCTTSGWARSLQAVLDELAAQEVPNEPGMNTNLGVNPGLVQVLDDADTPTNTWDKVLVWDYAASGRAGTDADKNLILRIRRGRYYPESGKGRKVFESMEHDHATNTGWVTANPNIPAFVAANAVLVELERPRVRVNSPKSRARAVYQSVKATALAVAGPVDEVMVAPFAIPVCSLLDEYGEFQGQRMAVTDRIFTEAARYCEGEGPNCNNYPMWPYTPCSCAYEDREDGYLWSEEYPEEIGGESTSNFFTSRTDLVGTDESPPYFCYHRMGSAPNHYQPANSSFIRWASDGSPTGGLPSEEWFSGTYGYDEYRRLSWFGKTELMASDHAAVVGVPDEIGGTRLTEDLILAILDTPEGTIPARVGGQFRILPQGLTHHGTIDTEERVWRQIAGENGSPETHPPMVETELGTIEKNYVQGVFGSYVWNQMNPWAVHWGLDVDGDGDIEGYVEESNDLIAGFYIWDTGLCSSRRVKLQGATRGDDLSVTPDTEGRRDIEYGAKAPEDCDLTAWWDENQADDYVLRFGDVDIPLGDAMDNGCSVCNSLPVTPPPPLPPFINLRATCCDLVVAIKTFWDSMGVVARIFAVPKPGVDDATPVWRVKVPVIAVRGPEGVACQDWDGDVDSELGYSVDWDPIVEPEANWEIIGFVDMLVYDVSIRDTSDWLPPFEQKKLYGAFTSSPILGPDDGMGKTYGPVPFYFFRGTDAAGNPVYGKEARMALAIDRSMIVWHPRSANAVRARITIGTNFIPTSANEGSRSPRLVQGWGRR